jgi:hypothetical protein
MWQKSKACLSLHSRLTCLQAILHEVEEGLDRARVVFLKLLEVERGVVLSRRVEGFHYDRDQTGAGFSFSGAKERPV